MLTDTIPSSRNPLPPKSQARELEIGKTRVSKNYHKYSYKLTYIWTKIIKGDKVSPQRISGGQGGVWW